MSKHGALMQPDDFRAWRKALGWKQKDAADRLGLKKRVIQYYEKGDRDGKSVEIPKSVELACLALALGFDGYDGSPVTRLTAPEGWTPDDAKAQGPDDEPGASDQEDMASQGSESAVGEGEGEPAAAKSAAAKKPAAKKAKPAASA